MNGVTLITCTGGRPESLARCASYVGRFENPHRLPAQWIVVDDGEGVSVPFPATATEGTMSVRYVKPGHVWTPGANTLALNLLEALPYAAHDAVLFIEDDDWYHADYMARCVDRLAHADIVGLTPSRYYHAPSSRWRVMQTRAHASLCQTAIRREHLPMLRNVCTRLPGEPYADFIDVRLWGAMAHLTTSYALFDHVVGIKGMPGRPGIGVGHRPDLGAGWTPDPGRVKLREWLGGDADLYIGPKQAE